MCGLNAALTPAAVVGISPSRQVSSFNLMSQCKHKITLHDKIETGDLNNISGTSKWLAEEGEGRGHEKNGCTYQLIK